MTRRFTTILAVLATILLLAGCTGTAPAPTAAPTAKPAAPTAAPAAKPTAPAAAPTKAAEPTKPAAAPTAAPAAKVDFPAKGKAVIMISNYPPGGTVDTYSRILAPALQEQLGVSVEIVNKGGASGLVGNTELARSKPDGYTIGNFSSPDNVVTYLDPEYKSVYSRKDYQPVANVMMDWGTLAVKADSPFKTLKDLVDAAKAKPEGVKIGTYGVKSKGHLQVLGFQKQAGVKFAVVQFDGGGPTMTAVLGGHIDVASVNMGAASAQFKSGAVRMLGAMGPERNPIFPDVPTFDSQGYKANYVVYQGQMVPAGTPREIVNVLAGAMKKAMDTPDFKKRMTEVGQTVKYLGPEEWGAIWAQHETEVQDLLKLAAEEMKK